MVSHLLARLIRSAEPPVLHSLPQIAEFTDATQIDGSRSATVVAPGDQVRNSPDPGQPGPESRQASPARGSVRCRAVAAVWLAAGQPTRLSCRRSPDATTTWRRCRPAGPLASSPRSSTATSTGTTRTTPATLIACRHTPPPKDCIRPVLAVLAEDKSRSHSVIHALDRHTTDRRICIVRESWALATITAQIRYYCASMRRGRRRLVRGQAWRPGIGRRWRLRVRGARLLVQLARRVLCPFGHG
jgi:hypothetical protein